MGDTCTVRAELVEKYSTDAKLVTLLLDDIKEKVIGTRTTYGAKKTTLLHWAASNSRLKLVQILLQRGECTSQRDMHGETALQLALKQITKPHDHHYRQVSKPQGTSPIFLALLSKATIDTIMNSEPEAKSRPNLWSRYGTITPARGPQRVPLFHLAASAGNCEALKSIMDAVKKLRDASRPSNPDQEGFVARLGEAAVAACEKGHDACLKVIIGHGAQTSKLGRRLS